MTPQTPPNPNDLLEQAHLAMLRGHTQQAMTLLDMLIAAEPGNDEAQNLRATLIAKHAAQTETMRLDAINAASARPPGLFTPRPNGSLWTRPLPSPTDALYNSTSARRWPKPLLLLACLGAGVAIPFLPSRHHSSYSHLSWRFEIGLGLIFGLYLFFRIAFRKR